MTTRKSALVLLIVLFVVGCNSRPRTTLWIWERDENLTSVDASTTDFAVLAKTIYLNGNQVISKPRLQPVTLPPNARTTAVVRIEAAPGFDVDVSRVAKELTTAVPFNALGLQIDFDARRSERPFYTALLQRVRNELPEDKSLSITALASWCLDDPWIRDLPVDEAIPMLFRMGPEAPHFRRRLKAGHDFRPSICRHSFGLSLDEPVSGLPSGRRVYVFAPRPWSAESLASARNLGVMP